jgi:hypothetical protein
MMNKNLLISALFTATFLPSCITYTKVVGEEPIRKRFESGETARIFYEAIFVSQEAINSNNDQSISVEVYFPIRWGEKYTDQKRVNDAFRLADADKNGTITLKEAQRFAKESLQSLQ